jgi:hypothetical protein
MRVSAFVGQVSVKIDAGALKPKEQGLSSNAVPPIKHLRTAILGSALALLGLAAQPLAAQDDKPATPPPSANPSSPPGRINIMVTRPRGDVNQAQAQECVDRADAGKISGEIVVCRQTGEDPDNAFSSPEEARKRYAEATANKNAPPPPNVFGIADGNFKVGFGGVPPPALMIDVAALPQAPAGSDADRIARGLPPLGQDLELTEEQEKARREAMGIKPAPQPIALPSNPQKKKKR